MTEPAALAAAVRAQALLREADPATPADLAATLRRMAPLMGADGAILLSRSARSWVPFDGSAADPAVLHACRGLGVGDADRVRRLESVPATVVPVRPSSLVLVLTGPAASLQDGEAARLLGASVDMVVRTVERCRAVSQAREEVSALQQAATEILSVRDFEEVLLYVTHTAHRLLAADIAGVFLREGDAVRMRSIVGNRTAETARVRLHRGQGLAGRVLETGRTVQVDDYLHTDVISDDYLGLAQSESMRSALGTPLIVRGDIVGVLEVWRRRRSVFSAREVERLVAMANLVTIAIENARLNDAQAASLRKLEAANSSLERQVELMRQSTVTQRTLIQLLLEGAGLAEIASGVATVTGARVAILSMTLDALATHPRDLDLAAVRAELRRGRRERSGPAPGRFRLRDGGGWASVQPIQAAGQSIGHLCLLSDEPPGDALEIAAGQAALVAALHHLEQRAADEARADARDEIVWDLLQGSTEYRRAAASRAERLHIDLHQHHRVFCCQLEGLDAAGTSDGLEPARMERVRHDLRRIVQRVSAGHGGADLVSLRGDTIVAVAACVAPAAARALATEATAEMVAALPGLISLWGVSGPRCSPLEYPIAYREATIAVRAAGRLGWHNQIAVFEELGVIRLLLAPGDQPDLADYVDELLGPMLEYDRRRGIPLMRTLRAYLDASCSLNVAATRLSVHQKTLRYRLNRIQELTHLDLSNNEDRFRADLALRILDVSSLQASLAGDRAPSADRR